MFGNVPDAVVSAGAVGLFAFTLLGMMWHILKSQQALITNHMSDGVKAMVELKAAVDRLADKL